MSTDSDPTDRSAYDYTAGMYVQGPDERVWEIKKCVYDVTDDKQAYLIQTPTGSDGGFWYYSKLESEYEINQSYEIVHESAWRRYNDDVTG